MLKLKELRLNKQITQAELSKALQISASAIGMYEQGRRQPDYATLSKLASYFNVTTDYLLGLSDEPQDTGFTPIPSQAAPALTAKDKAVALAYHAAPADKQRIVDVTLGLDDTAPPEAWKQGDVDDYHAALREEREPAPPTSSNTAELIGKKILAASTEAQIAINEIIESDKAANE